MSKRKIQFITGENLIGLTPNEKTLVKKGLLHMSVNHAKCKNIKHSNITPF